MGITVGVVGMVAEAVTKAAAKAMRGAAATPVMATEARANPGQTMEAAMVAITMVDTTRMEAALLAVAIRAARAQVQVGRLGEAEALARAVELARELVQITEARAQAQGALVRPGVAARALGLVLARVDPAMARELREALDNRLKVTTGALR